MKGKLFIALRLFSSRIDRRFIPIVNWISSFAIAIGLASILVVLSVMNGFEQEIYKKILNTEPHISLTRTADSQSAALNCKDYQMSEINRCQIYSQTKAIVESNSKLQGVLIKSYSYSKDDIDLISNDNVIAGSFASDLDIEIGDTLTVNIPISKNNELILKRMGSIQINRISNYENSKINSTEIILGLKLFKNLIGEFGVEEKVSIWLNDPFKAKSVTSIIERNNPLSKFEIIDWIDSNKSLFRAIMIEKSIMSVLLFLVVIIAIFNIMVMITMTIENKKGDIAILKSLGFNQGDVTQIFLIQGLLANIIGVIIGVSLALIILFNLENIEYISREYFNFDFFPPGLYILETMPYLIKLHEFLLISIATILSGLLLSYLPSRLSSKHSVSDLMKLYRS